MSAAQSGEDLLLDVADNGPGIRRKIAAHIFEAFYTGRAAKAVSLRYGHRPLVVLEFVNAHGGTVQIVDGEFRVRTCASPCPSARSAIGRRTSRRGTGPCRRERVKNA